MEKEKYYISTAIAYASGKPHIGNTYEIVLADAIARNKRLEGYDVYFQTGTDEHGEKIELKAKEAGITPQEFVDKKSAEIKRIWDVMNTTYDRFVRTSDPHHKEVVQHIFKKLYDQGDIYLDKYEGWYCTPCESFFTDTQLVDGKCPCNDPTCALCTSGLAGLHLCVLCKNGYYRFNYDCYCLINNCEQCSDNSCLKCRTGYFYNSTSNECEILEDENKILCYDENCESCFSEEKGACEYCKDGYTERKGECIELPILDINNTCPDRYYRSGDRCLEICSGVECNEVYEDNDNYYSCPSNKCLICVGNELKIWSKCDNSDICSEMDGCLNCITSDECVVCSQGYYLLGGVCLKCPDGCSSCSNNYTCDFCMSGYELNSDKECYLTYNFDFNTNVYSTFKTFLIFNFYPEELVQKEDPTEKPTEVDSKEITDSSSLFGRTSI